MCNCMCRGSLAAHPEIKSCTCHKFAMLSEYDKVYFFNVTLLLADIKEIHILKNIFGGINSQLLTLTASRTKNNTYVCYVQTNKTMRFVF